MEYLLLRGVDSVNGDVKRVDNAPKGKDRINGNEIPEDFRQVPFFNTLGYIKNSLNKIEPSPYFGPDDGLYVANIVPSVPIRVINLDRRQDRWNDINKRLLEAGIKHHTRFSAVDGTKLVMNDAIKNLFRNNDFNYRRGVVGCALSHIKLWQELISSQDDYMLIMEDDIELSENFEAKLNLVFHQMMQHPYIDLNFLGYFYWNGKPEKSNNYPNLQSIDIKSYMGGFYGYIISKPCAVKLLHLIKFNGVQNGIDRFAHINFNKMVVAHCEPHIIHSEYAVSGNSKDSDIQRDDNSLLNLPTNPILDKNNIIESKKDMDLSADKSKILVKPVWQFSNSKELCNYLNKLTKGGYIWNNIQLTDSNEADYFVIINKPGPPEYYDPKKTIIFHMEPWVYDESKPWGVKAWGKWATPNENVYYKVLTHKYHHNPLEWHLNKTYTELIDYHPEKTKLISTFVSEKNFDEGHIKRLEFLKYIENKTGDSVSIDIYGKGSAGYKNGKGFMEHKDDGMFPYKYSICVENNREKNYMTEKLADGILAECLCFYWGCPNVSDYIDSNAFITINLENFEETYNTIKNAIENDEWSKRIESIRDAKNKIMNELSIMPCIEKAVETNPIKKTVYYKVNGRFANNLFQYFAANTIKKIYGYDNVKFITNILPNSYIIDNKKFREICETNMAGKRLTIDTSKNICLDGYFQRSEIFLHYKDYIMSIFNDKNMDKVNQFISIKDIVSYKIKHNIPNDNDLVMHIRLDDFKGDNQIFDSEQLKNIIKEISYDKLYIVCDKLNQGWEKDYMKNFSELNPILIHGDMLDDFKLMMSCKKILISASTYSWMASYLNNNLTEAHIPYNTFHGEDQNLAEPHNGLTKIYRDIKYVKF